jgi:hypothetical protein
MSPHNADCGDHDRPVQDDEMERIDYTMAYIPIGRCLARDFLNLGANRRLAQGKPTPGHQMKLLCLCEENGR